MDVLAIYVKHDNEAFCEHWRISLHPWWTVIISDDNEALWIYMRLSKVGALGSLFVILFFLIGSFHSRLHWQERQHITFSLILHKPSNTDTIYTLSAHCVYMCVWEAERSRSVRNMSVWGLPKLWANAVWCINYEDGGSGGVLACVSVCVGEKQRKWSVFCLCVPLNERGGVLKSFDVLIMFQADWVSLC